MVNEQAFTFPFKARDWGGKFLVGSLLLLASYIIPIIPAIFVLGYVMRGMVYTVDTGEKRLEDWDDWVDLGVKGILYILVYFIYLLPGLVLFAGGLTSAGVGIMLQGSAGTALTFPLLVAGRLFLIFAIAVFVAAAVVLIIGVLMAPVAIARLAATGELARALEADRVWAIILSQIGDFFLAWGLTIGFGYVASMLYGMLYYTVCCCILIPILAAPISFYILIFSMTLFAQVYRQGESVTSDAPLLLPDKTQPEAQSPPEGARASEHDSVEAKPEISGRPAPVSSYELPLNVLELPARAERILLENGFVTVGQVLQALEKDEEELLSIKGFGAKSLDELKAKLRARGFVD